MKAALTLSAVMGPAFSTGSLSAQTAAQTCAKMLAEGRLELLSVERCTCDYGSGAHVLSAEIQALLFESGQDSVNNTDKVEALKPLSRIQKQFKALPGTIDRECS